MLLNKFLSLIIGLIVFLALLPACAPKPAPTPLETPTPVPTPTPTPPPTPTPSLPFFRILSVATDVSEVVQGKSLLVSVRVENMGDVGGIFDTPIKVNDTTIVTLSSHIPGKTEKLLQTRIWIDTPGIARIKIGDYELQIRVLRPASFVLKELKTSKADYLIGEKIIITLEMLNVGEAAGEFVSTLKIGEEEKPIRAYIEPGQIKVLNFQTVKDRPGSYKVEVGQLAAKFNILHKLVPEIANLYQQVDPRQIEVDVQSWTGKLISLEGKTLTVRYFLDKNLTWVGLLADVPGVLYSPVTMAIHVPGKVEWLLPDTRIRVFGVVQGTEEVTIVLTGATKKVPRVKAHYVIKPEEAPEIGTRLKPVPLGEPITLESKDGKVVRVTFKEVIRGDMAWTLIYQANRFNDPPSSGNEYVLIWVRLEYLKAPSDKPLTSWDYSFNLVSRGVVFEDPYVVEPKPALGKELYPGGIDEGWIALEGPKGDENAVVRFRLGFIDYVEAWFALLPRK